VLDNRCFDFQEGQEFSEDSSLLGCYIMSTGKYLSACDSSCSADREYEDITVFRNVGSCLPVPQMIVSGH
jgi:hypothetical protein